MDHPFTMAQDFPVGVDRLWTAIGREDYVRAKYRALGTPALRLRRFQATAERVEVDLERDLPRAVPLPPGLGATGHALRTLRQRSTWRRDARGEVQVTLEIAPLGLPLVAAGEGSVRPTGPHACRLALRWQVRADEVPGLLRGAASAIFARRVREALAQDHAFTLGWLARATARASAAAGH